MIKAEEKMIQSDLDMMKNPVSWKQYPFLPIKSNKTGKLQVGFLYADKKPVIYLENIFNIGEMGIQTIKDLQSKIKFVVYVSFEDILRDEWIVD